MKAIAGIFLLAAGALAQTAALLPQPKAQFFDNSGRPLAGGLVYTCAAGGACPGQPLASYQDSAASTPNANPVVLDSAGRAPIWLADAPYKIVVKSAAGVTITTTDNVRGAGYANSGPWQTSGSTIYNGSSGTKICIGSTPCTSSLALLNIQGASSGSNYLIRIDDSANSPGIALYGSGSRLGSYVADTAGLRLRSGDGSSQMVVASGNVTVQNGGAGGTTLTLKGGSAQGSANLLDVQSNSGTSLAFIDSAGRLAATLVNATPATGTDIAFQTANSNFQVNGNGDISSAGTINVSNAMVLDAARNAHFNTLICDSSPCGSGGGGGGGTGTPGGSNTFVQYNNSGAFGGSSNFTWDNTAKLLTVHAADASSAGIAVGTGFIQSVGGFSAPTSTSYNAFHAPTGGAAARSFTASKYVQVGTSAGAPTATTDDTFHAGALYWDTGSAAMQVYNGSGWVSLGGGSGSPGGSDTNVQYGSSGSFAGSGNFTWDNAARLLTVSATNSSSAGIAVANGFIQAAAGFLAPAGTATAYNAIQAPSGGMAARSFTATKYIQTGSGTTDPTVTTADSFNPGALYYNTAAGQMKVYNGSAWTNLGGSGGTPGGASSNIQFNSAGGFGGSSALTWTGTSQLLTVTALSSASPGIAVGTGYVQSDAGFLATAATAVNWNAIQAPAGGVYARSLRSTNYTQVGNSFGTPAATTGDTFQPGALYYSTSLGQLQLFNGGSWVSVGGASGGGVSSLAGTAGQVLVNGGTAAATGAVTLSLPQAIGTSSVPTFAGLFANGAFNSTASGFSIGFQISNALGNPFQVDGTGNVSAANQLNLTGSGSVYKMRGTAVINNSGAFVGTGVDVGSNGISSGGYNLAGGYLGQTWDIGIPGGFSINGSGSFTTLVFRGGILVSAR